jgi:hypothetical protein
MKATSSSEAWINFYQTIRRHNPDDSHCHKNLKFDVVLRVVLYGCVFFLKERTLIGSEEYCHLGCDAVYSSRSFDVILRP